MIKQTNNLSKSPAIDITSYVAKKNENMILPDSNNIYQNITENHYIFLQWDISKIPTNTRIANQYLQLYHLPVKGKYQIKIYEIPENEKIRPDKLVNLINTYTKEDIDPVQINIMEYPEKTEEEKSIFSLELINRYTKNIIIQIVKDQNNQETEPLNLYDIERIARQEAVINLIICEVKGLHPIYTYDQISDPYIGNSYINMSTGELIHQLMPI